MAAILQPGARIELFSGPGCAQCAAAKALMSARGLAFREIDVSTPEGMADFRARLPRMKAIPQIMVEGAHIGGLEDLRLALA